MSHKTFIVTHPRARAPIVVHGKTLAQALRTEGLDPKIWKVSRPVLGGSDSEHGYSQGDARSEDN